MHRGPFHMLGMLRVRSDRLAGPFPADREPWQVSRIVSRGGSASGSMRLQGGRASRCGKEPGMSAYGNKGVVRRVFEEAFNRGNLDVIGELIDPELVYQSPDGDVRGLEGVRQRQVAGSAR